MEEPTAVRHRRIATGAIYDGGQAVVEKLCGQGSNGTTPASALTTRIISEVSSSADRPLVGTAQTPLVS